jgi:hypothetical protein
MSKEGEESSANDVYKYVDVLNIPTKFVYDLSIKHLCSSSIVFNIEKDKSYLYYKILSEHLTVNDYKSVVKHNQKCMM